LLDQFVNFDIRIEVLASSTALEMNKTVTVGFTLGAELIVDSVDVHLSQVPEWRLLELLDRSLGLLCAATRASSFNGPSNRSAL